MLLGRNILSPSTIPSSDVALCPSHEPLTPRENELDFGHGPRLSKPHRLASSANSENRDGTLVVLVVAAGLLQVQERLVEALREGCPSTRTRPAPTRPWNLPWASITALRVGVQLQALTLMGHPSTRTRRTQLGLVQVLTHTGVAVRGHHQHHRRGGRRRSSCTAPGTETGGASDTARAGPRSRNTSAARQTHIRRGDGRSCRSLLAFVVETMQATSVPAPSSPGPTRSRPV